MTVDRTIRREVLTGLRRSGIVRSLPVMRRPATWLRRYVIGYVADESPPGAELRARCVPNGTVVVCIDIDGPSRRTLASSGELPPSPVTGLHDTVQLLDQLGRRHAAAVVLTPWGAHTLFGVGMYELANRHVDLANLVGPEAGELAERLAAELGWTARFAMLDEALSRWLVDRPEPSAEVVRAWRLLEQSMGMVPIEALARDVEWSRRRLEMRFRDQIGLSPKKIARILRFHRAAQALAHGDRSVSAVALDCGYWDQAHLNLDFRTLCGHTPINLMNALRSDRQPAIGPGDHQAAPD